MSIGEYFEGGPDIQGVNYVETLTPRERRRNYIRAGRWRRLTTEHYSFDCYSILLVKRYLGFWFPPWRSMDWCVDLDKSLLEAQDSKTGFILGELRMHIKGMDAKAREGKPCVASPLGY